MKRGGSKCVEVLHDIIAEAQIKPEVPQEWKDAQFDHYRGTFLQSIPGKIFAQVLLNRCGSMLLRAERTADMIFFQTNTGEMHRAKHATVHGVFFDRTKAFDSVNRS